MTIIMKTTTTTATATPIHGKRRSPRQHQNHAFSFDSSPAPLSSPLSTKKPTFSPRSSPPSSPSSGSFKASYRWMRNGVVGVVITAVISLQFFLAAQLTQVAVLNSHADPTTTLTTLTTAAAGQQQAGGVDAMIMPPHPSLSLAEKTKQEFVVSSFKNDHDVASTGRILPESNNHENEDASLQQQQSRNASASSPSTLDLAQAIKTSRLYVQSFVSLSSNATHHQQQETLPENNITTALSLPLPLDQPGMGHIGRELGFIHIPKSGGSTMEFAVAAKHGVLWGYCFMKRDVKACPDPSTTQNQPRWLPFDVHDVPAWHIPPWIFPLGDTGSYQPYAGLDLFAIVRHPMQRMISEYHYSCRMAKQRCLKHKNHESPLDAYFHERLEPKHRHPTAVTDAMDYFVDWGHWIPQYDYFVGPLEVRYIDYALLLDDEQVMADSFDQLVTAYHLVNLTWPTSSHKSSSNSSSHHKSNAGSYNTTVDDLRNDLKEKLHKRFDPDWNLFHQRPTQEEEESAQSS